MLSVPDHLIFHATSKCNMNMKNHYYTNQITHEEEGICVCFSISKSTYGNFIKETKEDFVAPKQVLFFWHFFIIKSEEPYFGDCPCMWKHNVFSPWASMCEVMFAKVVHQRMTLCHACWSCATNGAKFIGFFC